MNKLWIAALAMCVGSAMAVYGEVARTDAGKIMGKKISRVPVPGDNGKVLVFENGTTWHYITLPVTPGDVGADPAGSAAARQARIAKHDCGTGKAFKLYSSGVFSCASSAAGGGSGTITGVSVTSPLTGGGSSGSVSVGLGSVAFPNISSAGKWKAQDCSYIVAASNAPAQIKKSADYVCDGVADDVQLQAALYAVITGTGRGTVCATAGDFYLTSTLLMSNYQHLRGQGQDETIFNRSTDYGDTVKISASNPAANIVYGANISGIGFVSSNGMTNGAAIHALSANKVTVHDITTRNHWGGILFEGVSNFFVDRWISQS